MLCRPSEQTKLLTGVFDVDLCLLMLDSQNMPYASIEEKREKQRETYRQKYHSSRKFRDREAARKARYYQENPEYQERLKLKVYQARGVA